MKERPILFSAPMVRGLRAGRKTQTRRTNGLDDVNEDPGIWVSTGIFTSDGFGELGYMAKKSAKGKPGATFKTDKLSPGTINVCPQVCPYGIPGDRLWVRETWAVCEPYPSDDSDTADKLGLPLLPLPPELVPYWRKRVMFRAGLPDDVKPCDVIERGSADKQWRPSIFMPRWASRITLEITEVRVERLQEISEPDAIAEGIEYDEGTMHCANYCDVEDDARIGRWLGPLGSYASLWESINGAGKWAANPWVWAITFKIVQI